MAKKHHSTFGVSKQLLRRPLLLKSRLRDNFYHPNNLKNLARGSTVEARVILFDSRHECYWRYPGIMPLPSHPAANFCLTPPKLHFQLGRYDRISNLVFGILIGESVSWFCHSSMSPIVLPPPFKWILIIRHAMKIVCYLFWIWRFWWKSEREESNANLIALKKCYC